MTDAPRIVIVGAGPAGTRAAERLVQAGLRPIVLDEGAASGGQIYRRQPENFSRPPEKLYGADAPRARALHQAFADLAEQVDYRPRTLAFAVAENHVLAVQDGAVARIGFDALVLATGATDRVLPLPGWTLPGVFSLGGAQIALKAQACAIGSRVLFLGTGPLLYLVAWQYLKAGAGVAAVLDTSPFAARLAALPQLAARPGLLARGAMQLLALRRAGIRVANGITPLAIEGAGAVASVRWRDGAGRLDSTACDALAMGWHLRPETQLADLAGCRFAFDASTRQWLPETDGDGRSSVAGVYLAGDGARIAGADAAEAAGRLVACALLADHGLAVEAGEIAALRGSLARLSRFAAGIQAAFPWPHALAAATDDATLVCRCEAITAGSLRQSATALDAPEVNRAKAFSRVGMGRCQGRMCGSAAAEIVAAARNQPIEAVGRLRGQPPIKPLPASARLPEPVR